MIIFCIVLIIIIIFNDYDKRNKDKRLDAIIENSIAISDMKDKDIYSNYNCQGCIVFFDKDIIKIIKSNKMIDDIIDDNDGEYMLIPFITSGYENINFLARDLKKKYEGKIV